jgi:hypothetical protein
MLTLVKRWLAVVCLGLVAGGAIGCSVDAATEQEPSLGTELAPPSDPNATDPDHGAPKKPLPKDPTGWGSNQNGKEFPHYGRIEIKLCDLPDGFRTWDDGKQRSWCRGELKRQGHEMPASYTNHELVETRGNQKYLAVYKVDKEDHSSSGRPRMYHPPDPNRGGKAYRGGIAQLRDVQDHHFEKKKPPPKKKERFRSQRTGVDPPLAEGECDGSECTTCAECAATPEEVADTCGESCPLFAPLLFDADPSPVDAGPPDDGEWYQPTCIDDRLPDQEDEDDGESCTGDDNSPFCERTSSCPHHCVTCDDAWTGCFSCES